MLTEYLIDTYKPGEPIFVTDLPGNSRDYVRQEMKRLTDEGVLERLYNGVYFISYTTILGTKGRVSVEDYITKRYLEKNGKPNGYRTGLQLANAYGFTTQNPACYEVCSNAATTKQRKQEVDGQSIIVYRPMCEITEKNVKTLQFLDLMQVIDRYTELKGERLQKKWHDYIQRQDVDFDEVKKYLPLYPDRVYRNLYEGGLMHALV